MTNDLKLIQIRKAKEADLPYIYSSWMEDYLSSHHCKLKEGRTKTLQSYIALMPRELYFKEQRAIIDQILRKSTVTIACNEDDEDQIFGYAVHRYVGEIDILSWVYIRPVYRGFGICNLLMEHIGKSDVVTHLTPYRRWFLKKYDLIYNPFMESIDD